MLSINPLGDGGDPRMQQLLLMLQGLMAQPKQKQAPDNADYGAVQSFRAAQKGKGYGAWSDDTGWSPLDAYGNRVGFYGWNAASPILNPKRNAVDVLAGQSEDASRAGNMDAYVRAQTGNFGARYSPPTDPASRARLGADQWRQMGDYEQQALNRQYYGDEAAGKLQANTRPSAYDRAQAKFKEWEANPRTPELQRMRNQEAAYNDEVMRFSDPSAVMNNPGQWNPAEVGMGGIRQPSWDNLRSTESDPSQPYYTSGLGDYERALKRQATSAWADNEASNLYNQRQGRTDYWGAVDRERLVPASDDPAYGGKQWVQPTTEWDPGTAGLRQQWGEQYIPEYGVSNPASSYNEDYRPQEISQSEWADW